MNRIILVFCSFFAVTFLFAQSPVILQGDFQGGATAVATVWRDCSNSTEVNPWSAYGGPSATELCAEMEADANGPLNQLCQNVTNLTIGNSYTIIFDAQRRPSPVFTPNPLVSEITVDGGALAPSQFNRSNTVWNWTQESFTFTATQTTHLVSMKCLTPSNFGIGMIIDNVSISDNGPSATPVPTLAEWGMILLGMSTLFLGSLFITKMV